MSGLPASSSQTVRGGRGRRPRRSPPRKSLAWLGLALVVQAIPGVAGPGPRDRVPTTSEESIALARGSGDVPSRSETRSSSAISTLSVVAGVPVDGGGGTERVKAPCPSGMVAVGGGIAASDASEMTVSSSGPVYGSTGERLFLQPVGPKPAPTGWRVTATNTGNASSLKVGVVCDARNLDFFEGDDGPEPDR